MKRVDRITKISKSYFYININDEEYGLCLNENDLKNKNQIEKDLIFENETNKKSIECYMGR